jgi:hypothetical protein
MSGLRISDYTYKKTMEHYSFLRGKSTMAINHRSGLRMVLNLMGRFFEFNNKFWTNIWFVYDDLNSAV